MKIIRNNVIPFPGFKAINLCGVLFVRKNAIITEETINHERIHTAQMKELGYVLFYILYISEYLYNLMSCWSFKKAYRNISFEREAYENQSNMEYLKTRKHYAWIAYA